MASPPLFLSHSPSWSKRQAVSSPALQLLSKSLKVLWPQKKGKKEKKKSPLISPGKWTFSVSNKSNSPARRSSSLIRDVYWRLCLSSCHDEKKL